MRTVPALLAALLLLSACGGESSSTPPEPTACDDLSAAYLACCHKIADKAENQKCLAQTPDYSRLIESSCESALASYSCSAK